MSVKYKKKTIQNELSMCNTQSSESHNVKSNAQYTPQEQGSISTGCAAHQLGYISYYYGYQLSANVARTSCYKEMT